MEGERRGAGRQIVGAMLFPTCVAGRGGRRDGRQEEPEERLLLVVNVLFVL